MPQLCRLCLVKIDRKLKFDSSKFTIAHVTSSTLNVVLGLIRSVIQSWNRVTRDQKRIFAQTDLVEFIVLSGC